MGTDVANVFFVEVEDLDCGCGCGEVGATELGKLRPLKASVTPSKASCDCVSGGDVPAKEGCLGCGAGTSAFGVDAYRERIDCLRSGRD